MRTELTRAVSEAVCAVVGIPEHELWSRRQAERHMLARGLAVYLICEIGDWSIRAVARQTGMHPRTLRVARAMIADRRSSPPIRRALWDAVAAMRLDPSRVVPSASVSSSAGERVPA